jgi:hypothetical protein
MSVVFFEACEATPSARQGAGNDVVRFAVTGEDHLVGVVLDFAVSLGRHRREARSVALPFGSGSKKSRMMQSSFVHPFKDRAESKTKRY